MVLTLREQIFEFHWILIYRLQLGDITAENRASMKRCIQEDFQEKLTADALMALEEEIKKHEEQRRQRAVLKK